VQIAFAFMRRIFSEARTRAYRATVKPCAPAQSFMMAAGGAS
jgi:hypothetical protein